MSRYNAKVEAIRSTIRDGRVGDRKAIWRIIRNRRLNPFGIDWSKFLVAVDPEERVIGIGQLKSHRRDSVELASIAVVRRYERQGIATDIIVSLIRRAEPGVWLSCLQKMREFYRQFGFEEVPPKDVAPGYYRIFARVSSIIALFGGANQRVIAMRISDVPSTLSD